MKKAKHKSVICVEKALGKATIQEMTMRSIGNLIMAVIGNTNSNADTP
jgi:hypothetical protein